MFWVFGWFLSGILGFCIVIKIDKEGLAPEDSWLVFISLLGPILLVLSLWDAVDKAATKKESN